MRDSAVSHRQRLDCGHIFDLIQGISSTRENRLRWALAVLCNRYFPAMRNHCGTQGVAHAVFPGVFTKGMSFRQSDQCKRTAGGPICG
jgi:hypothetical protein